MNKKIFAFDLDGTYIADSKDNKVLPSSIEAIKMIKKQGHIPVIATGRPLWDVQGAVEGEKLFDYIICSNGTYAFSNIDQKFVFIDEIDKKLVDNLVAVAKQNNTLVAIHGDKCTKRYRVANQVEKYEQIIVDEEWKKFGHIYQIEEFSIAQLGGKQITQFSFRSDSENIQKIYEQIKHFANEASVVVASSVYIDVNPLDTNKFSGLKKLSQILNVSVDNIIAFGDSDNDLEMLEHVGQGVCMGNGTKNAKKHADEIIGTNKENSIFSFVEQALKNL